MRALVTRNDCVSPAHPLRWTHTLFARVLAVQPQMTRHASRGAAWATPLPRPASTASGPAMIISAARRGGNARNRPS
jgi:hypothetical protein